METTETRRENLRHLVTDAGGAVAFASRIGRSPATVATWCKEGAISDSAARHVEVVIDRERGWLDHPQWRKQEGIATGMDDDPHADLQRALAALPPDERMLLEHYLAGSDAERAMVAANDATASQRGRRDLIDQARFPAFRVLPIACAAAFSTSLPASPAAK